MYKVCKQFGSNYDIEINPQKSKLMVLENSKDLLLMITLLSVGPQMIDKDITRKCNELIVNANHIIHVFRKASP